MKKIWLGGNIPAQPDFLFGDGRMEKEGQAVPFYGTRLGDQAADEKDDPVIF